MKRYLMVKIFDFEFLVSCCRVANALFKNEIWEQSDDFWRSYGPCCSIPPKLLKIKEKIEGDILIPFWRRAFSLHVIEIWKQFYEHSLSYGPCSEETKYESQAHWFIYMGPRQRKGSFWSKLCMCLCCVVEWPIFCSKMKFESDPIILDGVMALAVSRTNKPLIGAKSSGVSGWYIFKLFSQSVKWTWQQFLDFEFLSKQLRHRSNGPTN